VKGAQRLRRAADFRRVRDQAGRGIPHPLLVLFVVPNDAGQTRVGITVSGRVGKAVVRNRARRRIRAALDARLGRIRPGLDLVILARPAIAQAAWADIAGALDQVLGRAGLLRAAPPTPATEVAAACV
jgi:ribonuclease P protein component